MPESIEAMRVRCPSCRRFFEIPASIPPEIKAPVESQSELALQEDGASDKGRLVGIIAAVAVAGVLFASLLFYLATRTSSDTVPQDDTVATATEDPLPKPKPPVKPKPIPKPKPVKPPADSTGGAPIVNPVPVAPKIKPTPKPKPLVMSPDELFAKAAPAVVRVEVRDAGFRRIGLGSAFFVSSDGLLVTNYHVIEGAKFASIRLGDKTTLFVEGIAAVNAKADLALLKVNVKGQSFLTLDDGQQPKVGVKVYAIGTPQDLENTFSDGMVSGYRDIDGVTLMQISVPISHGSSGGPLLTGNGLVVGVTSGGWRGGQNLNYAIQSAQVAELIRRKGKLQSLASAGGKRLSKSASAELDKAWKAIAGKDWVAAAKILSPLRVTHKDNPAVWFALGYMYGTSGNHEAAIKHYRTAIALKPDFAVAYYNIGINYTALKQYSNAIAAFKRSITLKPDYAKAHYNKGTAYRYLGQYAEALAAYDRAIAIDPNCAQAYCGMGFVYEKQRLDTKAVAAYKKAIAAKPDYAVVYYNLGAAYERIADASDAHRRLRAMLARNEAGLRVDKVSYAKYLLEYRRQIDLAVAAYRQYLRLEPRGGLASYATAAIRRLRN
jgi:S1-C subfamily serine protease/cytochrome c-type biogenesis protein CcmH/NrfG